MKLKRENIKLKKTEIVFILDKSGSMYSIKDDAIGGFNSFIDGQKEIEGEVNVTLTLFNSTVDVGKSVNVNAIEPLSDQSYQPQGGTALLDAIGLSIDSLNKRLSELPVSEQPDNIIFAIMTDGAENTSYQYNVTQVKNKIENMQNRDYQFIFLGANIDAVGTAKGLGIRGENAGQFVARGNGASTAILHAKEMAVSYATTGQMMSYADAINKSIAESGKTIGEALQNLSEAVKADKEVKPTTTELVINIEQPKKENADKIAKELIKELKKKGE